MNDPFSSWSGLSQVSEIVGQGAAAFLASFTQHERLLTLETSLPEGALLIERFRGTEALSQRFRFELDCLSTSAHFELDALLGEELTVGLRLADGSRRCFHGYLAEFGQLGSDGGFARYRLVLVGWLEFLALRRDSYVFQDKSVPEIAQALFADYPQASFRFDLQSAYPKRSLTLQYRESDYDFLARLLAEEGISYAFTHAEAAAAPGHAGPANGQAHHTLVLFDHNDAVPAAPQAAVRFHRSDATEASDTITQWGARREIRANAVALASWDYKKLSATGTAQASSAEAGELPTLEHYDAAGPYRYTDTGEAERIARARLESLEARNKTYRGAGGVRALAAGTWFKLTDHAYADSLAGRPRSRDEFVVLSVEHEAANNLFADQKAGNTAGGAEHGTYRNHFTALARDVPVRPDCFLPKPTAPGPQVALVVGIEAEVISSERDHRVKIQFPWARGARAASGQGLHPADSNAPGDERAGTWVRVAETLAGNNWGANFLPRIGQEVIVDFFEGDIDRPVIIGRAYNGQDRPPFHGADNHPGALAGVRSQALDGAGYNRWTLDDTPGQLRQQLASSYASTQLNLGYTVAQQDNTRGAYRGRGFELRSDAWGALRAASGLLITTAQRPNQNGTQLEAQEASGRLEAARTSATALSDTATAHRTPATSSERIEAMKATLSAQEGAQGQAQDPQVTAFAAPVVALDSVSAGLFATPASTLLMAGQSVQASAQGPMRFAAGTAVSIGAGGAAALYADQGGIKAIAAHGPVSLEAHAGPMDLLADQALTVTSRNGAIVIHAKDEIVLAAGGASIRLAGQNIDFTLPRLFSVKGSAHSLAGPGRLQAELPNLPTAENCTHWVELNYRDVEALPMDGAPYTLRFDNGVTIKGALDGSGHARIDGVPNEAYVVEYGEAQSNPVMRHVAPPNPFYGQGVPGTQAQAAERLQAFMDQDDAYMKDNYFPDEIAAASTDGGASAQTEHFPDYVMQSEKAEAQALATYREEHPEGQEGAQ